MINLEKVDNYITCAWQGMTLKAIKEFIEIPSKSTAFDSQWKKNGFLQEACLKAKAWGETIFSDAHFEVLNKPGLPPVLFFDIPQSSDAYEASVFFYGHFDKQPECTGWIAPREPWKPVEEHGKLYGRGGADDGYSFYAALSAIAALDQAQIQRPRVVGIIECNEESGSGGFDVYFDEIRPKLGPVSVVNILDGSCADMNRLWNNGSARGVMSLTFKIDVLKTSVHSGHGSGLIPSSFDVLRILLDRLQNPLTGEVLVKSCHGEIPTFYAESLKKTANLMGDSIWQEFEWAQKTKPRFEEDHYRMLLARSWCPSLSVIGMDGIPGTTTASGLVRASTTVTISIRLSPNADAQTALKDVKELLLNDIPFEANVELLDAHVAPGFMAPEAQPWFKKAWSSASEELCQNAPADIAVGGTIGILTLFKKAFPQANFLLTGVLGPGTNAHAPNEYLDLEYVTKITKAIARILIAHPKEK